MTNTTPSTSMYHAYTLWPDGVYRYYGDFTSEAEAREALVLEKDWYIVDDQEQVITKILKEIRG